jgi:xanthine dehydrogenase YagT iron-sulfur-binding subunit
MSIDSDKSSKPAEFDVDQNENAASGWSRREFFEQAIAGGVVVAGGMIGPATSQIACAEPAATAKTPLLEIGLRVNGRKHEFKVDPRVTLLDALREHLGMTGTKKGCDHGQCGACTVLVGGRRIYSCLTLAAMHQDEPITTIEGLAEGEKLDPMQEAFIKHDAFQCGYCTSGQICSAIGLLSEGHANSDEEIRDQMSGNICRCGAYVNICAAIKEVQAQKPK